MTLELGEYNTQDEAAYAYNVGMLLIDPECSPNALNQGMALTDEQKKRIEVRVRALLIERGWVGR